MNYINTLLTLQNQLRIFHWQTTSRAQHVALGEAYETLDELIDTFVEAFMGSNGIVRSEGGFNIHVDNIDKKDIVEFVNGNIKFLVTELPKSFEPTETNLLNIRDEMINSLQKLKYLLNQK
jgi:hypothetical protein